jgi:hypothetical protein
MRCLAKRRVLKVEAFTPFTDDNYSGVDADPNANFGISTRFDVWRIPHHILMHASSRNACVQRMMFVRYRCAKDCHHAVAHHLIDEAAAVADGINH